MPSARHPLTQSVPRHSQPLPSCRPSHRMHPPPQSASRESPPPKPVPPTSNLPDQGRRDEASPLLFPEHLGPPPPSAAAVRSHPWSCRQTKFRSPLSSAQTRTTDHLASQTSVTCSSQTVLSNASHWKQTPPSQIRSRCIRRSPHFANKGRIEMIPARVTPESTAALPQKLPAMRASGRTAGCPSRELPPDAARDAAGHKSAHK